MLEGFCEQGDDPSTAIEDVEFYRGGKERGLGVFDSRVLWQVFGSKRYLREMCVEGIHDLSCSSNHWIIEWAGHVERMAEKRN